MACCECEAATKRMSPPVAVLTHCTSPVPEKARRSAEELPTGVARRQRPCLSRASRVKDGASSQAGEDVSGGLTMRSQRTPSRSMGAAADADGAPATGGGPRSGEGEEEMLEMR